MHSTSLLLAEPTGLEAVVGLLEAADWGQGGAPHAAGPAVETLVLGSRGAASELDGEPGEGRRNKTNYLRCFRGKEAPRPRLKHTRRFVCTTEARCDNAEDNPVHTQ